MVSKKQPGPVDAGRPPWLLPVLATASCLVAFSAVVVLVQGDDPPPLRAAPLESPGEPPGLIVESQGRAESSSPEGLAQGPSPRELLEEFWGPDFSAVVAEAEALGANLNLDAPVNGYLLWPEAEALISERLSSNEPKIEDRVPPSDDWPAAVSPEFLDGPFGKFVHSLSDSELRAIDSVAQPFSQRIGDLAAEKNRVILDAMLSSWQGGKYKKAPLFIPPSSPLAGVAHSRIISMHGWCVEMNLMHSDWPAIGEMQNQIEAAKRERRVQVAEYIKAIGGD